MLLRSEPISITILLSTQSYKICFYCQFLKFSTATETFSAALLYYIVYFWIKSNVSISLQDGMKSLEVIQVM